MAEDGAAPKASTPYGAAAALLGQAAADAQLPGAVVVLDSVLVRSSSSSAPAAHQQQQQQHHHQPVQLLDEAVSVLSALAARHVPLALLLSCAQGGSGGGAAGLQECLAEAGVQLHTVVEVDMAQAHQQQQQQVEQQPEQHPHQQQQQQHQHANANAGSSRWMTDAAASLKAQTGVPWAQMLLCLPAGGGGSSVDDVARLARRLGMSVVSVPAATGLSVACLREGLSAYACKLEADRGY